MPIPSRRSFCKALAAAPLSICAAPPVPRPNIIFVLTDDQGYGDLRCHGNPVVKTPNLDRLHGESVRFTDYHVSPTCSPTRAALMTGRHEFKSGVTHTINERERMSLKATTLAEVLKSAGYATGIFGKWHLGDAAAYQPNRRGFDEMFIHGCGGIGQSYPGTCSDAPGNMYTNPTLMHNGAFEKTQGYCTDLFFNQALKWVDGKRQSGQPFFAYIATNAPHVPLQCPEEYQRMYKGLHLTENEEKYFGMVTNIDDNVGRLMARLKDWGMDRNTLVIFMTDNGGTGGVKVFNAGMRGAKNSPYQGGTRVPAFFRWTGVLKPGDVNKLSAHIDILPTLAEFAGAKIPGNIQLDGRSLMPLLKNPDAPWADRYLFTHIGRWEKGRAAESKYAQCRVRGSRFSMVRMGPEKGWELYDVKADPGESKDVVSEHPEAVGQMNAAYDKWWQEILPCLENENAVPPKVSPYKELYWRQFGGGPKG
ncbi:MAG: arylsulfatase [Acidobacteriota bacterium]|nr:arylsulfatase [Acidobacteriota bacterium]